ncbi:hypothetical protein [Streptomyces sp. NPDC058812]|uniref:hypothetical protein n=1 Tax=unclassified Streptomyces TaxID=2593676 RepID=UPI0036B402F5
MPATLVAEHVAPVVTSSPAVSVTDLSNGERAVALYASDMPDSYRHQRGEDARLIAWIIQGVTRMGLDELRHTAALASGFRRLRQAKRVTAEQKRAHTERFPNAKRDRRTGELASLLTLSVPMSNEARDRGLRYLLDGPCPECGDTRQVWASWSVDVDADWYEEGYGPCFVCGGAA